MGRPVEPGGPRQNLGGAGVLDRRLVGQPRQHLRPGVPGPDVVPVQPRQDLGLAGPLAADQTVFRRQGLRGLVVLAVVLQTRQHLRPGLVVDDRRAALGRGGGGGLQRDAAMAELGARS